MQTFIRFIPMALVFLSVHSFAATKVSPLQFTLSCEVELANGGKSKVLKGESKPFAAISGEPVGMESDVRISFGPYTLSGNLQQISEERVSGVPIPPPSSPELGMNIFKGHPLKSSIFRANASGFRWEEMSRPQTLSGFQFLNVKHEGVSYTRVDYKCRLAKVPEKAKI